MNKTHLAELRGMMAALWKAEKTKISKERRWQRAGKSSSKVGREMKLVEQARQSEAEGWSTEEKTESPGMKRRKRDRVETGFE
jgi:hypothetical protein